MDAKTDELVQQYVATGGDPEQWWQTWAGSYSIAPTDNAVIVRDRGAGRILELVRWDWQRPPRMPRGAPIINARVEKLTTNFWAPAFRAARVVVPMRGYFEWTGPAGDKTPHFVHGDGMLSAAGLTWSMDVAGAPTRCMVVITREARDAAGELHDRMPSFLTLDAVEEWLDPAPLEGADDQQRLLSTLQGASDAVATTIRQHVVDRSVNNVRTANTLDPATIAPVR